MVIQLQDACPASEPPIDKRSSLLQNDVGNRLLRLFSPEDFAVLAPYLTRVPLELNGMLAHAGEPIVDVCFPESGVIGFVDVLASGERLAVAITGREGFVGWPLMLGNDCWPHEAVVRARSGTALRISADKLRDVIAVSEGARSLLLRFASSLVAQMTRTIASNLIHDVERRTARWILLYHDRLDGDEIAITHEELGVMLGARRSSITDALHQLEGAGAIKGFRGRLSVRDRLQLERLVGDTYGFAESEYRRLLTAGAGSGGFSSPAASRRSL